MSDLRLRAGIKVTTARGMTLTADALEPDVKGDFAMLIVPGGGEGALRISANPIVEAMVRLRYDNRHWIAAFVLTQSLFNRNGTYFEGRKQLVTRIQRSAGGISRAARC